MWEIEGKNACCVFIWLSVHFIYCIFGRSGNGHILCAHSFYPSFFCLSLSLCHFYSRKKRRWANNVDFHVFISFTSNFFYPSIFSALGSLCNFIALVAFIKSSLFKFFLVQLRSRCYFIRGVILCTHVFYWFQLLRRQNENNNVYRPFFFLLRMPKTYTKGIPVCVRVGVVFRWCVLNAGVYIYKPLGMKPWFYQSKTMNLFTEKRGNLNQIHAKDIHIVLVATTCFYAATPN